MPSGLARVSWSAMLDPYDTIAPFYDRTLAGFDDDLALYLMLAAQQAGAVLEIGAGTGRLAVPLAEAGHAVTALEPSAAMLRLGRAATEAATVPVEWVAGRIEDFAAERRYALVIAALDSFLHLTDTTAQLAALAAIRGVLTPGGLLALDLPTLAGWPDWQPGVRPLDLLWSERDPLSGRTTSQLNSFQMDPATQRRTVTEVFEQSETDGTLRRWLATYTLRFIGRFELQLLVEHAGLRLRSLHGDYELGPLSETSERMIALIERAE